VFCDKEYLSFIENSKSQSLDMVTISVTKTKGHTYAKVGNMMLVNSKGEFTGVLGSPHLHEKILDLARKSLKSKTILSYKNTPKDKNSNHGISWYLIQAFFYEKNYGLLNLCLKNFGKTLVRNLHDNSYEIVNKIIETKFEDGKFYQHIQKPYSLLIFGSGSHITSLVSMAILMGWETTVIDINLRKASVKQAHKLIKLDKLDDIFSVNLDYYNACVILSHSPKTDDVYLKALLNSNVEYIGMLGNKKNMEKKSKQFNLENNSRFFAPVGTDIGGKTHQGIALSICSQIEARKNKKI